MCFVVIGDFACFAGGGCWVCLVLGFWSLGFPELFCMFCVDVWFGVCTFAVLVLEWVLTWGLYSVTCSFVGFCVWAWIAFCGWFRLHCCGFA